MVAANFHCAKPTISVVWICFASIAGVLFGVLTSLHWKENTTLNISLVLSVQPFLGPRIVTMNMRARFTVIIITQPSLRSDAMAVTQPS